MVTFTLVFKIILFKIYLKLIISLLLYIIAYSHENSTMIKKSYLIFTRNFFLQAALLMGRWRYPWLTIHEIETGYLCSAGLTTIPRQVTGRFSVRIVGSQDPNKVIKLVTSYIDHLWKQRNSSNKFKVINFKSVVSINVIVY